MFMIIKNKKNKTKTEILLHKANMFYIFMCVCVRLGADRVFLQPSYVAVICVRLEAEVSRMEYRFRLGKYSVVRLLAR